MAEPARLPPDVRVAVDAGDAHRLAAALAPLSDRQRRALRQPLRDRLLTAHGLQPARRDWPRHLQTVDLVVEVACCGPSEVGWAWWRLAPDPAAREAQLALASDVLAARPLSVRRALVREVCAADGSASAAWPVLRTLQDRGRLDDVALDPDDLALGAVRAVWSLVRDTAEGIDWQDPPDDVIVRAVDRDPALCGHLLRALRHPPALDAAGRAWPAWLSTAVAAGVLPRDVVLSSVLRAQDADARPSTAQLLRRMLDALAPTEDELVAHEAQLVRILADAHPSAARQAAGHLQTLAAAGRLVDAVAVADATSGPLTGRQKNAALATLRLLEALPLGDGTVAAAAVAGLAHVHEDVQGRALDLVEGRAPGHSSAAVREVALLHLDAVAPAHRDRVAALAGVDGLGAPAGGAVDVEQLRDRAAALPVTVRDLLRADVACDAAAAGRRPDAAVPPPAWAPPGDPVAPVATAAELAELLGFLLGGSADAMDLERAIDGLARIDGRRAPATVTSVVARHARTVLEQGPDAGSGVLGQLVGQLGGAWARGAAPDELGYLRPTRGSRRLLRRRRPAGGLLHELVTPPRARHEFDEHPDGGAAMAGLGGFVQARLYEAVVISRQGPRATLALPSTTAGWIDADDLADRVGALDAAGRRPARHEAVATLLRLRDPAVLRGRLPRDGPTAALAAAIDGDDDADVALLRAVDRTTTLGALTFASEEQQPGLVRSTPWFAVPGPPPWRRDDPVGQLLRELGEQASRHASSWWNPNRNVLPEADRPIMRWAPTAVPHASHLLAAATTRSVLVDPDADRSSSAVDALLAHALDPDVPLAHPWHLLLATTLRAGNRVAGITAADVVAVAAADARLDPTLLGQHLARLHDAGIGASNRVAERLGSVVDDAPLVAAGIRRTVQAWVAAIAGLPRDLHHVLSLLELACAASGAGVDDDDTRSVLDRAATGRSKRAAIAGRLLALPATAPAHEPEHLAGAVVERAERWTADGASRP